MERMRKSNQQASKSISRGSSSDTRSMQDFDFQGMSTALVPLCLWHAWSTFSSMVFFLSCPAAEHMNGREIYRKSGPIRARKYLAQSMEYPIVCLGYALLVEDQSWPRRDLNGGLSRHLRIVRGGVVEVEVLPASHLMSLPPLGYSAWLSYHELRGCHQSR